MSVAFSYKLVGRGWSECTLTIDEQQITVIASYLSDALGDLLGAVVRIIEGEQEARASFDEEPGEYRWRLSRRGAGRLQVRILKFARKWDNRPDDEGKLIFDAECRLRTFAGAVLSASQNLFEECGKEGYLEQWVNNEFPLEKQEQLRHLLRQR